MDGSEPTKRKRNDKTVITLRYPDRALEQSENFDNVKLIDLYCMHNGYRTEGPELYQALQEIADICNVPLPEYLERKRNGNMNGEFNMNVE